MGVGERDILTPKLPWEQRGLESPSSSSSSFVSISYHGPTTAIRHAVQGKEARIELRKESRDTRGEHLHQRKEVIGNEEGKGKGKGKERKGNEEEKKRKIKRRKRRKGKERKGKKDRGRKEEEKEKE